MTSRKVDVGEGLDPSSLTCFPAVLREDILLTQLRPFTHKPYFIRLLQPPLLGHSSPRRPYSSISKIQIGGWKYYTDDYHKNTYHLIIEKYTPLANALRSQWLDTQVDIIPIVMSHTRIPHNPTHTSITSLINPRTDPPDKHSQTPATRHYPSHLQPSHKLCPMATPHAPYLPH
jgi:hypothetical protein